MGRPRNPKIMYFRGLFRSSLAQHNFEEHLIFKIDAFGNIEWRRVFNSNSREYHQFRASGTKNGNLIIATGSVNIVDNDLIVTYLKTHTYNYNQLNVRSDLKIILDTLVPTARLIIHN